MNYYIDTEFLEGTQTKRFLGIPYGKTPPTIDLISIGIVSEDGREYYAIYKDFNLKEAWNRFQLEDDNSVGVRIGVLPSKKKIYWIRENVLLPIIYELAQKDYNEKGAFIAEFGNYNNWLGFIKRNKSWEKIWFKRTKELINKYGKINKQIAEEIVKFINSETVSQTSTSNTASQLTQKSIDNIKKGYLKPQFYAYYADYDWVVFCWLFGKMIDLPNGFPMYCKDLKQILDDKGNPDHKRYVAQENEHNALNDARWNKKLHEFLINL